MSILVLFAIIAPVTTIRILAQLGYSPSGSLHQGPNELRIRELLAKDFVESQLARMGEPAWFILCTRFLALHKTLISSDFNRIRHQREHYRRRPNLERSTVFVNNSSPH